MCLNSLLKDPSQLVALPEAHLESSGGRGERCALAWASEVAAEAWSRVQAAPEASSCEGCFMSAGKAGWLHPHKHGQRPCVASHPSVPRSGQISSRTFTHQTVVSPTHNTK